MSCIDSHVLRSAASWSHCDHELHGWLVGVAASVVNALYEREFDIEIDAHWEPLTPEEHELWWRLHICRRRIEFAMVPSSEWERRYYARYEEIRAWLESLTNPPAPSVCLTCEDISF